MQKKAILIDADVNAYRTSGCFAMAAALNRLTEHPVRCIDFGSITHAFVLTPNNEVIDIHGKMSWHEFMDFLVAENGLSVDAVKRSLVLPLEITPELTRWWPNRGYKEPSETAIRKAMSIARKHPNLENVIKEESLLKPAEISLITASDDQPAQDDQEDYFSDAPTNL